METTLSLQGEGPVQIDRSGKLHHPSSAQSLPFRECETDCESSGDPSLLTPEEPVQLVQEDEDYYDCLLPSPARG